MPEPTEHHRDDQVVVGLIQTLFSYAYMATCNQSEIAFLQFAGGKGVETIDICFMLARSSTT